MKGWGGTRMKNKETELITLRGSSIIFRKRTNALHNDHFQE